MCSFNISSQILPGCSSVIDIRDDEGDCDNCNQSQSPSQSATAGALVPIDVEEIGEPIPAASVAPSSSKSSGPRPRPRFRLAFHKQKKWWYGRWSNGTSWIVEDDAACSGPRSSFTSKKIIQQAAQKNGRIKGLQNQLRGLRKKLLGVQKTVDKTKSQLQIQSEKPETRFAVQKVGKKDVRFSLQSKFSIGLRRGYTNVAAADFGILAMCDVSKQSVIRFEHMTASSIIRLMHLFVAAGLKTCLEAHGKNEWSLISVGYRCDGTNTNIWRKKKIHCLEATVSWLRDTKQLLHGNVDAAMITRHCVSFYALLNIVVLWVCGFCFQKNTILYRCFASRASKIWIEISAAQF